jgi:hypothetical protein
LLLLSFRYQAMRVKGHEGDVPYCEYMACKLGAEWKHDQYGRAGWGLQPGVP